MSMESTTNTLYVKCTVYNHIGKIYLFTFPFDSLVITLY